MSRKASGAGRIRSDEERTGGMPGVRGRTWYVVEPKATVKGTRTCGATGAAASCMKCERVGEELGVTADCGEGTPEASRLSTRPDAATDTDDVVKTSETSSAASQSDRPAPGSGNPSGTGGGCCSAPLP